MRQVEAQAANDDPQMARLDPRASKLKYRLERLMLTPFFRFTLRVLLPFGLCFGIGAAWFAVDENREAFHLMLSEVRDTVENRPEFQVRMMAIDGAAPEVAAAIREDLSIDFPKSSFDLDLEQVQRTVTALDAVKTAQVRVRQGGVLQVDVIQRQPVVLWRTADGLQLLDDEGVFVGPAAARAAYAALPVVAGDAAELAVDEALRLYALTGPVRARLRGFERIGARRWDVVLDRDQRIMLPEAGAERALEQAIGMALTPGLDLLARDLTVVDLRLPRRPTIRMTEDATQKMWRIKAIEAGREVVR
ncbi:cell division protein FtsQ [Antarctobacter heliothermus]|uniref:Cell division protein FtsQ n=1 Tax=Antarctobacter heliothermus TaxID=74033 RepID=A0A222E9I4_9RHOB|nr:cell division protein FtsQ/DivIB [Antarctobacter heliothermus]ASP22867.1 cell division protein FtsQ [Antarctobacter heliothermus]